MGGAIFVMDGASIVISGFFTVDGNTVAGGNGGSVFSFSSGPGASGSAFGSGIFLQGNNATLTFDPGADTLQTVANDIADQTGSGGTRANAGSVGLTKTGAGTLQLTGNNTYSGTTTISAGTLQVGNGEDRGSLGGGEVGIGTGATLAFDRNDVATVANTLSGGGSVAQIGSGTTVLTGDNSYTGGTRIDSGTLQIGNGGTGGRLGAGEVVLNNGVLAFNHSNAAGPITVANTISGRGGLSKAGTSTLVLTGNNSYEGDTVIDAGTLQVGNGGTTGSLGTGGGRQQRHTGLQPQRCHIGGQHHQRQRQREQGRRQHAGAHRQQQL
jgi:autotransporter-associated beta strand protein